MGLDDKWLEKITDEAKDDETLVNDYEKFFYSIFQGKIKLSKIREEKYPTPDFKFEFFGEEYITEVKGLDPIYEDAGDVFREICEEINRKDLLTDYSLHVEPVNIHVKEDKEIVEEKLKENLKGIKPGQQNINFQIKTKRTSYEFKLEKDDKNILFGAYYKEVSNLKYALRGNKQYEKIDFLTLINLNQENDKDRFKEEVFNLKGSIVVIIPNESINIDVFEENIFHRHNNIKFVLVLDLVTDFAYVMTTPFQKMTAHFEIFLHYLILILKSAEFKVRINTIKLDWMDA